MEVLNLINGSHGPAVSGKTLDLTDPSKGEVYGSIPRSTREDVDLAVAAAKAAFENWKNTPAEKKRGMFRQTCRQGSRKFGVFSEGRVER